MSYNLPQERPGGVAVVTGGAAGLGATFVATLLRLGHRVAILDRTIERSPDDPHLFRFQGDATDPADVALFGAKVRELLGPPRVVVNNVGMSPYRTFAQETLDGWRAVMAVNVESAVLVCHEFLDDLRSQPDARIVNLTSSVLWDAEVRGMVAYEAAKGAVLGLTRALARELGADDVTVNAIAPGIVRTPDTARVPEQTLEAYRLRQAVPRIADPEDLASSLEYLVSRGSGQVTGVVLGVNGGRVWL